MATWPHAHSWGLLVRPIACFPSHPIGSDPGAGCEPLGDRGHRSQGPIQNAVKAVQDEPVNDLLASALGLHESAVPKTRQMRGHSRLRLLDCSDQLADRALMVLKELEDPEPRRIAQDAEETGGGGSIGRSQNRGIHIWQAGYHVPMASCGANPRRKVRCQIRPLLTATPTPSRRRCHRLPPSSSTWSWRSTEQCLPASHRRLRPSPPTPDGSPLKQPTSLQNGPVCT